jgi:TolB-like protein
VRFGVLPFENIQVGSDREYLVDGLTDETIAALGLCCALFLANLQIPSAARRPSAAAAGARFANAG